MKLIKFITIFFSLISISSCSKFLTNEIPSEVVSPNDFYKTAYAFTTALNGVYAQLNNMSYPLLLMGDGGTDISQFGINGGFITVNNIPQNDFTEIIENSTDGQNVLLTDYWKYSYLLINNANKIITEAEKLDVNIPKEKDKFRYISEAKFLRALTYFYLVQFFGPIPLKTETSDPNKGNILVPFSPVKDVYNLIVQDLQYCEGFYVTTISGTTNTVNNFYLKRTRYTGSDLGRPDFFVAKGLLSKVFLAKSSTETGAQRLASLDSAKRNASEVIGSGIYSLNRKYEDNFLPDSKFGSQENMFSIQFSSSFRSRSYVLFGAATAWVRNLPNPLLAPWGGYFGLNVIQVPQYLVSMYNSNDLRLPVSALNTIAVNSGSVGVAIFPGYITAKYYDPSFSSGIEGGVQGGNTVNTNILRYSDILLVYAEAENEINGPSFEAYDKLNQVLRRAGLPDINVTGGVTQDNFRNEILKQRALEFCYEGQRRFDLIRTGKLTQKLLESGKNAPQFITFPYPQSELNYNPQ